MRFVTYLIAGLYSTKWFATCFEEPKPDKSDDVAASKNFDFNGILDIDNSENDSYASNVEYFDLKEEPLISPPLFEDVSWNNSVSKVYSGKRNIQERGLSHQAKMQILQLHNIYRSNVTPPAGDMRFMEWDEELARLAQLWSDGCVMDHGNPPNDLEPIGQNLYIGDDPTGYRGLWMWYEEHHDYDMRKQYCLPNKMCGHYVQMAWAATYRIGCGMTRCGARYLHTCNYLPPALRSVQMYRVAKPCSQCPSKNGDLCLKNLCLSWDQCKQNPFDCQFAQCDLECLNCGRLDKENCMCECADGWDSPDCSHLCGDKVKYCGRQPGYPNKQSCSLNNFQVAETFCRQMCGMCNKLDETYSTHTCCNGTLCDQGYVLDPDEKSCKCKLLCPGPICDSKEEGEVQASLQNTNEAHLTPRAGYFLTLWILAFLWICKDFKTNEI